VWREGKGGEVAEEVKREDLVDEGRGCKEGEKTRPGEGKGGRMGGAKFSARGIFSQLEERGIQEGNTTRRVR